VEINTMHWVGLTDLTYEDITPLALVDIVPSSVLVADDSQFESLEGLLDHARENPGDLTASGTSQGGIWHLALAGMLNAEGLEPDAIRWIPSQGAAPALQELIAGGVDVATPALSEGKGLIESGDVRALAYMHDEPMAALPDVPLTSEILDSGWTLAAYITTSGPGGMPENIACSYAQAIDEIIATDEWAEFKASRGAEVVQMSREELRDFMARNDEALGDVIESVGLAE
jgi:tripartite-type tricarboxylate transporter receptor subunit TctC